MRAFLFRCIRCECAYTRRLTYTLVFSCMFVLPGCYVCGLAEVELAAGIGGLVCNGCYLCGENKAREVVWWLFSSLMVRWFSMGVYIYIDMYVSLRVGTTYCVK